MTKDPKILLQHIAESIKSVETYTASVDRDQFLVSEQLQDSVIRRLEVIGEAIKNIPDSVKAAHPDIPWRNIAGMRDNLIHEYFDVDIELVWDTVQKDIPILKRAVEKLLAT